MCLYLKPDKNISGTIYYRQLNKDCINRQKTKRHNSCLEVFNELNQFLETELHILHIPHLTVINDVSLGKYLFRFFLQYRQVVVPAGEMSEQKFFCIGLSGYGCGLFCCGVRGFLCEAGMFFGKCGFMV